MSLFSMERTRVTRLRVLEDQRISCVFGSKADSSICHSAIGEPNLHGGYGLNMLLAYLVCLPVSRDMTTLGYYHNRTYGAERP